MSMEAIQVAKDTNAIIVYTLIKPEMKQYMSEKYIIPIEFR